MKEFKQYKIEAKDYQEKAEIIGIFVKLGYTDYTSGGEGLTINSSSNGGVISYIHLKYASGHRITIEQLREMAEMKEYLVKENGKYVLCVGDVKPSGAIEVPKGADAARGLDGGIEFYKDDFNLYFDEIEMVWSETNLPQKTLLKWVVWQRTTQPEELPSIDDKPKHSVDDTLAARQSTYGDFTSVASTTGQLMAIIRNSKNGQTMPYAHDEALHMICSKIARIVNGDHNHKDSWHDIGGYAKLIEDLI